MALTSLPVTDGYPEFVYTSSNQAWGPPSQTSDLSGTHERIVGSSEAPTWHPCKAPLDCVLESMHSGTMRLQNLRRGADVKRHLQGESGIQKNEDTTSLENTGDFQEQFSEIIDLDLTSVNLALDCQS